MTKNPLGSHIMCRLADGRVVAPAVADRRTVARVVFERTRGEPLLAHGIPDTHLHSLLGPGCSVPPDEIGRRIQLALNRRLGLDVSFQKATVKPIGNQQHLSRCFEYVLTQNQRHGLSWDPLHEASSVHDLLGLRLTGSSSVTNVRACLPRVGRADLLRFIGLAELEPLPVCDWAVRHAGLLVDAGAAALALPDLKGKAIEVRAAKRAIIEFAGRWMKDIEIAALLNVTARTIRRLRPVAPDPRLVTAVRLQLALRRVKAVE